MNQPSIFTDTRQAARFAFALEAYPLGSQGAAVRLALADARATVKPELPPGTSNESLRDYGQQVRRAIDADLLRAEAAALTAAFSRDIDQRRAAIRTLHPLFCNLLARLTDDRALVFKLLERNYMPLRERGAKWELSALADEFKAGRTRVVRAAQAIDNCASQLERQALASLAAQLQPKADAKAQQEPEAAHA